MPDDKYTGPFFDNHGNWHPQYKAWALTRLESVIRNEIPGLFGPSEAHHIAKMVERHFVFLPRG